MNDEASHIDPVGKLADEFMERYRRGESPSLDEYIEKYPEFAERIRELFPMLVMMEKAGADASVEQASPVSPSHEPALKQIGEYRLLREIGRGGMGIVYEAEQISLDRRVALKILSAQIANDEGLMDRFRREAQAAARLHHTNIVPVYDIGREGDTQYYAMQLIGGQALDDVIRELKQLREMSKRQGPQTADGTKSPTGISPPKGAADTTPQETYDAGSIARSLFTDRISLSPPKKRDSEASPRLDRTVIQEEAGDSSFQETELEQPSESRQKTVRMELENKQGTSVMLPGQSDAGFVEGQIQHYFKSVAQIGVQVADALVHAHREGIIHRDIKPSNLLLDMQGQVWITDFGLAKTEGDSLTKTGDVLGTLQYMPPERFRGRSDEGGDIYSLGITLYEMLTLRPAFKADDRMKIMHQVMHSSPPRLRSIDPRIPADLETIVNKTIAREPHHRYQSAEDLKADLQRFLEDRPISARRVSQSEQFWRWCRRNPIIAGLALATLVLFLVGFAGVTSQWLRAESNADEANRYAKKAKLAADQAQTEARQADAAAERERDARLEAEAARKRIRRLLYLAHMNLIPEAWDEANISRIHGLLQTHVPDEGEEDLRGFEWYYWWRESHQFQNSLDHGGPVFAVDGSSDGRLVVSAGGGQSQIKFWNAKTGSLKDTLQGPSGWIQAMDLSPDGRWLAAGENAGKVWLWDRKKDERRTLPGSPEEPVQTLAFSPDGTMLAAGSRDGSLRLWDIPSGEVRTVWDEHPGAVQTLAWSPEGKSIATALGGWSSERKTKQIWIRDIESGDVRHLPQGTGPLTLGLAFSPDGNLLAATGTNGVLLWNLRTEHLTRFKEHQDVVTAAAFSPDGRYLASAGSDRRIQIWDPGQSSHVDTLKGHGSTIGSLAFTADGQRLISGSEDGTVKIWEDFPHDDSVFDHNASVRTVAVSPDNRTLATAGESKDLRIWDLKTAEQRQAFQGKLQTVTQVAFSPDGTWIAACGSQIASPHGGPGLVEVWSLQTGKLLQKFGESEKRIWDLAISPDGRRIATGGADGSVKIWTAPAGELKQTLAENHGTVRAVAFSPDGKTLSSAGNDMAVRLWNLKTGERTGFLKGHTQTVFDLAFSPDGHTLASVGQDRTIRLWKLPDGTLQTVIKGHPKRVMSVAFSPDGRTLATGSGDQTVRLWDTVTKGQKCRLQGHPLRVDSVAFSPDGRTLVSGDISGQVRLWRAETHPLQTELQHTTAESQ